MLNSTVEHVLKQSVVYSYMLSQPLAVYVDAYPVLQNKQLLEAEQLEYGEHGESVRVLQSKLNKLSYYDDEIDGDYGILTEHALKKFQAKYHLRMSGQADEETIDKLIEVEMKMYLDQIEELSDSIYPGLHNNDVKIVQKALSYFGYYTGEIDGIYGPLTKKALEIAEEEHDIELTEKVSKESLTTLYQSSKAETKKVKTEQQQTDNERKETEKEIKNVEKTGKNHSGVVQAAYSYIGTPYVWGGESPGGFDCSGFIQYIYSTQNITTPRTVPEMWNFATPVNSPSIGDLVFFETYKPGPSHMGIYIGDGKFIHAGQSNGVEISKMEYDYWQKRYLGAKRIK
ncbi:NlpC/P60 family protein [Virgibacillus ndiopensis]|uniref:C40 family peptidase n=1 Tax=Virgibacillus ndiopensis TaxID=2004408 RepID=UPI000C08655A|nr:NlpC/P60 family protein [Virgibacillus ndiopensis]